MIYMKRALVCGIAFTLLFGLFSGCIFPRDNIPPVPFLAASATFVNVGDEVIFSGNDSVDKDGDIVRYFWNFGDGTNTTGKYVTHEYEKGDNYTVILIITDNDGKKAVQTITVHVNELPIPWIDMTLPAYIHEPVYFYANDSYDKDGFVQDYFWDFGDGTNATVMSTSHIYTEKKLFRVTLTVTDNDGGKAAFPLEFDIIYRTYKVEWIEDSVLVDAPSGYLAEENSEHLISTIDILNVTRIKFNLTWDDDIPFVGDPPLPVPVPNDEFLLNISSPDEEDFYEEGPSTSEKIILYAPKSGKINPIPPEDELEAESPEILRGYLAENWTTSEGTGDWLVNITLLVAGGALDLPVDADNGNTWQFSVVCYYYTPVITKIE
jgi:chitodextrinase